MDHLPLQFYQNYAFVRHFGDLISLRNVHDKVSEEYLPVSTL